MDDLVFSVSGFLDNLNQDLAYAFSGVVVEGEISSYKTSQGKWIFFDLKDDESSVNCFMPVWQLSIPLEDGMKVRAKVLPKVTKWGKFSLTVQKLIPVGEGSIKKAYELLKKKLTKEGLFDSAKKRPLPDNIVRIGVISSTGAAGYADFCKIINHRWAGLEIQVCHTQVQGLVAPEQMIRALNYLNEKAEVQVIAMIRGGGSADDLSCFNDESLVRAIASSKIPVITGIGHEVDETLADLAADVRASTPSNCAEMLTLDKSAEIRRIKSQTDGLSRRIFTAIVDVANELRISRDGLRQVLADKLTVENRELQSKISAMSSVMKKSVGELQAKADRDLVQLRHFLSEKLNHELAKIENTLKIIESMNPELVLRQGYAIIAGEIDVGKIIEITTITKHFTAEVKQITERSSNDGKES